jgi:hypothetical protein
MKIALLQCSKKQKEKKRKREKGWQEKGISLKW